jgi:hypothetical protein
MPPAGSWSKPARAHAVSVCLPHHQGARYVRRERVEEEEASRSHSQTSHLSHSQTSLAYLTHKHLTHRQGARYVRRERVEEDEASRGESVWERNGQQRNDTRAEEAEASRGGNEERTK